MKQTLLYIICLFLTASGLYSCMDIDAIEEEGFDWGGVPAGEGIFIVNEGNFMYGNASLSFYDANSKHLENEVFARANSIKLGDVAQSMTIHNGTGYIVVNNSGVVFVVDINTCMVKGIIKNLTSPRYIHFVDNAKAYITDLYASHITIFDPRTLAVTGHIDTNGHRSTEQMVQYGDFVFANCWSGDNTVLVIDTNTDKVVDEIGVGTQPSSITLDANGKIWVLTDGGYDGSPYDWDRPGLFRLDPETRQIDKTFMFDKNDWPRGLCVNAAGDKLYFINESVFAMDIDAQDLPTTPLLKYSGTRYYTLGVSPGNSDIYVSDALDYVQSGVVYRLNRHGTPKDTLRTGVTPSAFCFR